MREMGEDISSSWIFQANPKFYDLSIKLHEHREYSITWQCSKFFKKIKKGDMIYLWQAGGNQPTKAGFYGWGIALTDPYIIDPPDQYGDKKLDIEYIGEFKSFIPKSEVKNNSCLETLTILRSPQGVNFRVRKSEELELERYKNEQGTPFEEPEEKTIVTHEEDIKTDRSLRFKEINIKGHTDEDVKLYVTISNELEKIMKFKVKVTSSFPNNDISTSFYRVKALEDYVISPIILGRPKFSGNTTINLELVNEEDIAILHEEVEVKIRKQLKKIVIAILKVAFRYSS